MVVFLLGKHMKIKFNEQLHATNFCQILAYTLPRFYQRTGISVKIISELDPTNKHFQISVDFDGSEKFDTDVAKLKDNSDKLFEIFFEEIKEAEKIVLNHRVLSNMHRFKNLEQMQTRYEEEAISLAKKHQQAIEKKS